MDYEREHLPRYGLRQASLYAMSTPLTRFALAARIFLLCFLALPSFGQEAPEEAVYLLREAHSLWAKEGRKAEAQEFLDRAYALAPDSVELRLEHAEFLEIIERHGEAMAAYKAIVTKDRASLEANLGYARSALASEEYGRVVTSMTRFLRRAEGQPDALALRAEAYYWRDNLVKAIRDFEAIEDLSERPSALATYSYSLTENGQFEEGVAAAARGVAFDIKDPSAHHVHARALSAAGEDRRADLAQARAVALDPDYADYDYKADDVYVFDPDAEPTADELIEIYGGMLKAFLVWAIAMGLLGLLVGLGGGRYLKPKEVSSSSAERRPKIQPVYDGPTKDLMGIYLQNVVFTVLTLGVYRFWAKVRTQRFHYEHTQFAGGRFDYHATCREKFVGFLKGMGFILPFIVGYYFLSQYASERPESIGFTLLLSYFPLLALYLIRPIAIVGGQRFNLARTSWNNLRFRFTGSVGAAYKLYARDLLLMVVTFGIYYSWHKRNVREFKLHNTTLGDERMGFVGTGREMFNIQVAGTILTMMTLGLYLPWWIAARERYFIGHSKFMDKRFHSSLKGMAVLSVGGPGLLVSILTLGIGLPWAITRWRTLMAVTTTYKGEIDAAKMSSIADAAATSTLEGVGEAGEFLGEIGDIFGI